MVWKPPCAQTLAFLALQKIQGLGSKSLYKLFLQGQELGLTWEIGEVCSFLTHALPTRHVPMSLLSEVYRSATKELTIYKKNRIEIIGCWSPFYPSRFREVSNTPVLIFAKGNLSHVQTKKSVAIIGTRRPSLLGAKAGKALTKHFVDAGCMIVSGLALGCDRIAHQVSLQYGGKTQK